MSDHLDHDESASGKIDPRVDIADLYIFPSPDAPGRTVLIMTVNPLAPAVGADFATDAVYEILIDTDGDARPDIAYRITFETVDGSQRATVRRATGDDARSRGVTGDVIIDAAAVSLDGSVRVADIGNTRRFFAGLRGDPFFFDLHGYLDGFAFTGDDLFADKNVCAIALEAPAEELGGGPIGVWCRILVRSHGKLIQIDRMGRPLVNVALTKGVEKDRFNQSDPDQDVALFVETFTRGLRRLGDHAVDQANAVARSLLPDILPFDPETAVGYPNGRVLADDIIDHQLALFTAGRITSDLVAAHRDTSDRFPYLGEPHQPA
jgi:hypothetical protein